MSRADVIALARELGLQSTDPVLLSTYYTEALIQFGMSTEILLEPTFIPVTQGVALYDVPDTNSIATCCFGLRELTKTTLTHLTTYDPEYKTRQGTPRIWCEEHENHNVVRLYPVPDATSAPAVLAPNPFGEDYALDYLVAFASNRDEDAAPWLDFPLACIILARDLTHQSAYRDPIIAEAVAKLGQIARQAGGAP